MPLSTATRAILRRYIAQMRALAPSVAAEGPGGTAARAVVAPRQSGPQPPLQLDRAEPASGIRGPAAPAWIDNAVVYGVHIPRFGQKPLQAVTKRLDYLRDLGVNTLWLSPVAPASDASDYGYEAVAFEGVRPELGTGAELRRLVREAHKRDMKVLLDVVVNHTSIHHPWAQDVQEAGRRSEFYDYYERDATGRPTHYFDWEGLGNLNFDNPKVQAAVSDSLAKWVTDYDIDGFRIDAAWGVQQRAPAFWPQVQKRLRRLKPDVALFAEASARDPYWAANGFHGAYDWKSKLGEWSWKHVFDGGKVSLPALRRELTQSGRRTANHNGAEVLRFLNNNDTGERFVARHGVDMARVAAGLLLTLPGVPMLYTGDEVGAKFLPYEASPKPVDFSRNPQLREHYRELIALRHRLPALRSDELTDLPTPARDEVLAYRRGGDGGDAVYVLLNFSGRSHTVPVVPGTLSDELTGERFAGTRDARTAVTLQPHSVRVLSSAPAA